MKALVTGITGQDGHYLREYLQELGYEVIGVARRVAQRVSLPDCRIECGDITDATAMAAIMDRVQPDEVYHLAAMSHVGESFKHPMTTWAVDALGAVNVLEAARRVGTKFYQASTSELFGMSPPPQNEATPMHPASPYGVAKLAAYWQARNYREAYGMYACNGILFNHESPYRGRDFVTQKVVRHAVAVAHGHREPLVLATLDTRRDWGHARDFVRAMHLVMQQPKSDDYVVATGASHSVRELCSLAYAMVGLDWEEWVEVDASTRRPLDVPDLIGDSTKIRRLGWGPEYGFERLIAEMVRVADASFSL